MRIIVWFYTPASIHMNKNATEFSENIFQIYERAHILKQLRYDVLYNFFDE